MSSNSACSRLGALRHQAKGFGHHFLGLRRIAAALQDAGHREVFSYRLLLLAEVLVRHGQAAVGQRMIAAQRRDMAPVLHGLVEIALFEECLGGPHGSLDRDVEVAEAFGDLRDLLQRGRVIGREAGDVLVGLQRLLEFAELIQRQSQAVEGIGLVRGELQCAAIAGRGLGPIQVPGRGMAVVQRLLISLIVGGHVFNWAVAISDCAVKS